MVFPGRLSTGCKLCRRRKVKCDENKPGCNRCAVYGRPCPGYGDNFQFRPQEAKVKKAISSRPAGSKANVTPTVSVKQRQGSGSESGGSISSTSGAEPTAFGEIVFKQESPGDEFQDVTELRTSSASSSSDLSPTTTTTRPTTEWQFEHQFSVAPRRPAATQQQQQERHQHVQAQKSRRQAHPQLTFATSYQQWLAPLPSPPPAPCRETQSLNYFMSRFVSHASADPFPGHLSFLYKLYDRDHVTSLELATLSAAEMTAYNKFGVPEMKQLAYKHRGLAIKELSALLNHPDRSVKFSDKTIGTVLLLATFNDVSGDASGRDGGHAPGLYYLLEQRGEQQLHTKTGAEIFFLAVMRLHINAFVTNDFRYADPGGLSILMQDVNPLWRGRALVCKIPRLRSALGDHLKSLASKYQLDTSDDKIPEQYKSPTSPNSARDGESTSPDHHIDETQIPPLQEEDIQTTMELYVSCMQVLHELREWDKSITSSPFFNPGVVEVQTPDSSDAGHGQPLSPLTPEAPTASAPHYDISTAVTVILLKSSRVMLLLSVLSYFKRLKDWTVQYPRLITGEGASPLLSAIFSDPSASMADVESMLDDVRESVDEIERCVPFAIGYAEDDLDGIASWQERPVAWNGEGWGGKGRRRSVRQTRSTDNQVEVAAAALLIMHSLILVAMCPYSSQRQKELSYNVLGRMDRNMGIRAAGWRLRQLLQEGPKGLFF